MLQWFYDIIVPTSEFHNDEHKRIAAVASGRVTDVGCRKAAMLHLWKGLTAEQQLGMIETMNKLHVMNELKDTDFASACGTLVRKRFNAWRQHARVRIMHTDKQVNAVTSAVIRHVGRTCVGKSGVACKRKCVFSAKGDFIGGKWQLDHAIRRTYINAEMKRCIDAVCKEQKLDAKVVYKLITPMRNVPALTPGALHSKLSKSTSDTAKIVASYIDFEAFSDDMFGTNVTLICRTCNVSETASDVKKATPCDTQRRYITSDTVRSS